MNLLSRFLSIIFLNWPSSASFCLFSSFQTTIKSLTTNIKMLWPSSIRRQDLNPWPLEHKSPPITTRPGLPPRFLSICTSVALRRQVETSNNILTDKSLKLLFYFRTNESWRLNGQKDKQTQTRQFLKSVNMEMEKATDYKQASCRQSVWLPPREMEYIERTSYNTFYPF